MNITATTALAQPAYSPSVLPVTIQAIPTTVMSTVLPAAIIARCHLLPILLMSYSWSRVYIKTQGVCYRTRSDLDHDLMHTSKALGQ